MKKTTIMDGVMSLLAPSLQTKKLEAYVRAEVQNPHTPTDVQDAVLPRIFNLQPGLNTSEQEARRRIALILQGSARYGKHAADASHLSEAAETGCAYFITEDARILGKRAELRPVLPPSIKVVTLIEFFVGL